MALLEAHRLPCDNLLNSKPDTHFYSERYWQETILQNVMSLPISGGPLDNFNAPIPSPSDTTQEGPVNGKKRKASKPKPIGELRRVVSTPQIRGIPMNDQIPPSPTAADKRRSKLGYHRSSVACTHCRKRKIRCILPTPPDPAGRCSHCIRLKKECKFEGVNESSPVDPKAKRSGPPSIADSTTPQASASQVSGLQDGSEQSHSHNTPLDTSFSGIPMYQDSQRRYGYPSSIGTENWNQEAITSPTGSTPYQREDPNSPYWSPTQDTHPTGFHQSSALNNSSAYGHPAYAAQPGQPAWSAQQRSMSLGHAEHMHQHYPYQQVAPYEQQRSDERGQHPSQVGQPMGLPAPPQIPQTYAYQPQEWQRYQMASAEQGGRDRSTYQYPDQYYAGPSAQQNSGMPSHHTMAYTNPPGYYPPASQQG